MTIFDRIKERRKALDWSQERLAEELGLKSRAAVSAVEKGKCDMTTDRIQRYAKALRTSPAYLMGWTDDPSPSSTLLHNIMFSTEQDLEREGFPPYYMREETEAMAQELFDNKDLRLLFDAAKDCRPEDLQMAADLLKRLKQTNPDG